MFYRWDAQSLHCLGYTPLPATGRILEPILKGAKQKRGVAGALHIYHAISCPVNGHNLGGRLLDNPPTFVLKERLRPLSVNAISYFPFCFHLQKHLPIPLKPSSTA